MWIKSELELEHDILSEFLWKPSHLLIPSLLPHSLMKITQYSLKCPKQQWRHIFVLSLSIIIKQLHSYKRTAYIRQSLVNSCHVIYHYVAHASTSYIYRGEWSYLKADSFSTPDLSILIERHHCFRILSRYCIRSVWSIKPSLPKVMHRFWASDLLS